MSSFELGARTNGQGPEWPSELTRRDGKAWRHEKGVALDYNVCVVCVHPYGLRLTREGATKQCPHACSIHNTGWRTLWVPPTLPRSNVERQEHELEMYSSCLAGQIWACCGPSTVAALVLSRADNNSRVFLIVIPGYQSLRADGERFNQGRSSQGKSVVGALRSVYQTPSADGANLAHKLC